MTKIQEILEIGLEEYLEKNKTIGYKQKVINAIKDCKTEKMGAHKYVCDELYAISSYPHSSHTY